MTDSSKICFIGIDVGTQGTKGILYHPSTQSILQRESISYSLAENPSKIEGRAEQDPCIWEDATETVLFRLFSFLNEENQNLKRENHYFVGGIGVSGQQHGMVPLDTNYEPVRNAKLWCDVEANVESSDFSHLASEKLGKTWNVPAGFTAPKVWWLKKHEPENFQKMQYCCLPHDYITFLLCGGKEKDSDGSNSLSIPVTDAGDASGTGVFDPKTRQYLPELTEIIDARYFGMLPKVITQPNAIAGYLSKQWKKRLNISVEEKIGISIGSGDNMCSALGVGCVQPQTAVLSLGTSGTIFGVSDSPITSDQNTVVAPFCDATGRFLPLICVMSCTGILENVLASFPTSTTQKITHEQATLLAKDVPKGCHGLLFLPFLNGERTPNWPHSKGALLGITAENLRFTHDLGVLYRAAMEGIAYTLRMGLDEIKNSTSEKKEIDTNPTFQTLLVVGGGSKNSLWRQILSDVLSVTLKFPVEAESAALGAAFQAGAAITGTSVDKYVMEQNVKMEKTVVVPSCNDGVHEYQRGYECFQQLSHKLFSE